MTETKKSWREVFRVHPAADLFPLLPEDELQKLAEDIRTNGLKEAIVFHVSDKGGEPLLIDGRNRLAAMEKAGIDFLDGWSFSEHKLRNLPQGSVEPNTKLLPSETDPQLYVISRNILRRHLTPEQRVSLAAQVMGLWKSEAAATKPTARERSQPVTKPHGHAQPKGAVAKISEVTNLDRKTARKHLAKIADEKVQSGEITKQHAEAIVSTKPAKTEATRVDVKPVSDRVAAGIERTERAKDKFYELAEQYQQLKALGEQKGRLWQKYRADKDSTPKFTGAEVWEDIEGIFSLIFSVIYSGKTVEPRRVLSKKNAAKQNENKTQPGPAGNGSTRV